MSSLLSRRPSLKDEDTTLRSSVEVRTGAQLVGLLVSHFTKATILAVLHLCIPVPDLVGWFSGTHVQFNFRTLFLSISPPLREATADQIETFSKLALKSALHALRGVIHLTCPSVVMAVLVLHRVIDASYIESLSPLLERPFEEVTTAVLGVSVLFSEHALARRDMDFHALSRDKVRDNFRNFRRHQTRIVISWGAFIGAEINKGWLHRLDAHKSELVTRYAEEYYRPLAAVPSLASSSSSSSSSSYSSSSSSAASAASSSSSSSSSGSSLYVTPTIRQNGTPASARSALSAPEPAPVLSTTKQMLLTSFASGLVPRQPQETLTDLKSVFPLTYATNNPLFPLLFQHNITHDKLAAFLDFKDNDDNPWNEKRCYQAMKLFMERTRDLANTQGLSYARSLDQRPCGKAVLLSTEQRYSSCTASILCILIFKKFLILSRDEGAEESNNSLVLMAFVDLSTDSNDFLMKEVAAFCAVSFHKNSRTIIEETIPHVSTIHFVVLLFLSFYYSCRFITSVVLLSCRFIARVV